MVRTAALALFLLTGVPAHAEEMWLRDPKFTGLWLSDVCRSDEEADRLYCDAYIRGIHAGQAMAAAIGKGGYAFCRDDQTVTIEQERRIIVKYADEHPEDLNRPDQIFAFMALASAFPCPRS